MTKRRIVKGVSDKKVIMDTLIPEDIDRFPWAGHLGLAMLGEVIEAISTANRVRVADPFPAFNLTPPQPATVCGMTLFCAASDIHPSDRGYQVIADVIWIASGYWRFER